MLDTSLDFEVFILNLMKESVYQYKHDQEDYTKVMSVMKDFSEE